MITITTSTKELASRANEVMNNEVLYNPNLSGVDFRVVNGDFDEIEGADAITSAILFNQIFKD